MNIFLCCTPLHVLLAAIKSTEYEDEETLYIIVKDAPGVDLLAETVLTGDQSRFFVIEGATSLSSEDRQAALRRRNIRKVRALLRHLAPKRIHVFFDQSAEAQTLLNHRFATSPRTILLEDGVSTYSVAEPFPKPVLRLIRNKLIFDKRWRGSKWVGEHPAIQEINCFYPQLLRTAMKDRRVKPLPRTIPKRTIDYFKSMYGEARYKSLIGIIVVPHPDSAPRSSQFGVFIEKSIDWCRSRGMEPVFKIHPRDRVTEHVLHKSHPDCRAAERAFPVELVLFVEKNIKAVIGYRTSALHVVSALHPNTSTYYYEPDSNATSKSWMTFFSRLSIPPLG